MHGQAGRGLRRRLAWPGGGRALPYASCHTLAEVRHQGTRRHFCPARQMHKDEAALRNQNTAVAHCTKLEQIKSRLWFWFVSRFWCQRAKGFLSAGDWRLWRRCHWGEGLPLSSQGRRCVNDAARESRPNFLTDKFASIKILIDPPLARVQLLVLLHNAASIRRTVVRTIDIHGAHTAL